MQEEPNGKSKKSQRSGNVEELVQILDLMGDWLPKFLPELMKAFRELAFSEQAGREMGKAVAAFYHELLKTGIPQEDATAMTHTYMSTIQDTIKQVLSSRSFNLTTGSSRNSHE